MQVETSFRVPPEGRGAAGQRETVEQEVWFVAPRSWRDGWQAHELSVNRGAEPAHVCRAVLADGGLVVGPADSSWDAMIDDLLRRDSGESS